MTWTAGYYSGARRVDAHPGRVGGPIVPWAVVVHTTDMAPETFAALVSAWRTKPGVGDCSHFLIGRDAMEGVVQFVPIDRNSNSAGGPHHGVFVAGGIEWHPNTVSVGVELHCAGGVQRIGGEWRLVEGGKPTGAPIPDLDVIPDPARPGRGWHRVTDYQYAQLETLLHELEYDGLGAAPGGVVARSTFQAPAEWALGAGRNCRALLARLPRPRGPTSNRNAVAASARGLARPDLALRRLVVGPKPLDEIGERGKIREARGLELAHELVAVDVLAVLVLGEDRSIASERRPRGQRYRVGHLVPERAHVEQLALAVDPQQAAVDHVAHDRELGAREPRRRRVAPADLVVAIERAAQRGRPTVLVVRVALDATGCVGGGLAVLARLGDAAVDLVAQVSRESQADWLVGLVGHDYFAPLCASQSPWLAAQMMLRAL